MKHRKPRRRLWIKAPVLGVVALVASLLQAPQSHAVTSSADACHTVNDAAPSGNCGRFTQTFRETFNGDSVKLGSFSGCNNKVETKAWYCSGLSATYRKEFTAYPRGWYDTANPKNHSNGNTRTLGGEYRADDTTWVAPVGTDGQMHIRMYRPASGDIHAAAIVPVAAIDQRYGKVSARIRVSKVAAGYKSAWLRYGGDCEDDFPEQNWTDTIVAFHHPCNGGSQDAYSSGAKWSAWHTVSTEWTPGHVRFFLDGKLLGHSDSSVASTPLTYVMQNESALEGAYAAKGSSAQMDITWVTVYDWR